jgi:hypothetical protein
MCAFGVVATHDGDDEITEWSEVLFQAVRDREVVDAPCQHFIERSVERPGCLRIGVG